MGGGKGKKAKGADAGEEAVEEMEVEAGDEVEAEGAELLPVEATFKETEESLMATLEAWAAATSR